MGNAKAVAAAEPEPSPRKVAVLRQARAVRTRNELVAAAIRLWSTQDFDEITVDAIVDAAGVSKGTFFYHFRRKEDLLVELGWSTVDRVGDEAEKAYAEDRDFDHAVDVGLAGLARRITAMPRGAVARTIQEFMFRSSSQPRSASSGRHAFMSGLFQAAQDAGDIPTSIDADELADVVNNVIIQTILDSVTGRTDEPLEPILRRRARLVLYGMHQSAPSQPQRPSARASSGTTTTARQETNRPDTPTRAVKPTKSSVRRSR
jgi:AcrR family transcriptional regulator